MNKSLLVRELAINLSSISTILAFLSGYYVGTGQWGLGLSIGCVYLALDNLTSRLWLVAIRGA